MVAQCLISKLFSQDEFWAFKLYNDILFMITMICDKEKGGGGEHKFYRLKCSSEFGHHNITMYSMKN